MRFKDFMILKNIFDFVFSVILSFLALPVIFIFAIISFAETKEFPLVVQERGLTLDSYRFKMYKLKTMKSQEKNIKSSQKNIFFKSGLSQYVIPFGKFLRRTGLDELPQLFNILKGEMSFVGPRPLSLTDLEIMKHSFPHEYSERGKNKFKPGITGYWQVFQNRNEGVENLITQEKFYSENYSFKLDMKILLNTVPIVFMGTHVDAILPGSKSDKLSKSSLEHIKRKGYKIEYPI